MAVLTPTKPSKNSAAVSLEDKGMDEKSWDDADHSWNDADYPWDTPEVVVKKNDKNSAALTQPSKS